MPRIHKDDPGLVYVRKTQDAGTVRESGADGKSRGYEDKKGKHEFLHEQLLLHSTLRSGSDDCGEREDGCENYSR